VTVVDNSKFNFVGKIHLADDAKREANGGTSKSANPGSTEYWVQIDMIQDLPPLPVKKGSGDGAGEGSQGGRRRTRTGNRKMNPISVTGLTNKSGSEQKTCRYNDPDDFLHLLALWQRANLSGEKKSLKLDANFVPEIFDCNVGKFPSNKEEYLKEREVESQSAKMEKEKEGEEEPPKNTLNISSEQEDATKEKVRRVRSVRKAEKRNRTNPNPLRSSSCSRWSLNMGRRGSWLWRLPLTV